MLVLAELRVESRELLEKYSSSVQCQSDSLQSVRQPQDLPCCSGTDINGLLGLVFVSLRLRLRGGGNDCVLIGGGKGTARGFEYAWNSSECLLERTCSPPLRTDSDLRRTSGGGNNSASWIGISRRMASIEVGSRIRCVCHPKPGWLYSLVVRECVYDRAAERRIMSLCLLRFAAIFALTSSAVKAAGVSVCNNLTGSIGSIGAGLFGGSGVKSAGSGNEMTLGSAFPFLAFVVFEKIAMVN